MLYLREAIIALLFACVQGSATLEGLGFAATTDVSDQ